MLKLGHMGTEMLATQEQDGWTSLLDVDINI
jgi:hypothetical protein